VGHGVPTNPKPPLSRNSATDVAAEQAGSRMGIKTDSGWAAGVAGLLVGVGLRITFARPSWMSETEMRGWVSDRARAGPPAITLDGLFRGGGDRLVLRLEVREDCAEAVEDQLAESLMSCDCSDCGRPSRPASRLGRCTYGTGLLCSTWVTPR
jgi:hypothetical protein